MEASKDWEQSVSDRIGVPVDSRNRPWCRTTWDRQINFPGPSQREKTLAPTDAFVREKTGCISPMAIRHHVGMASTSRQTVIKSIDNMHRNKGWEGRDTGETQNWLKKSGKEATTKNTPDAIFATENISREIISRLSRCARPARNTTSFIKGEVKAKIKISPVVVFGVLRRMVLVRESWDAPFLLESQSNSRTSTETGWLRPTRWGFVCKMSLKAPFRSYKSTDDRDWPICCSLLDAESTGFGPKRLRYSVRP